MPKPPSPNGSASPLQNHRHRRMRGAMADQFPAGKDGSDASIDVGRCLRGLRCRRGLSMRSLAEQSGLNINTLSLIENSKTSPSVSTLQQLANALDVPVTAFFETDVPKKNISYQKAGQRVAAAFAHGTLEDLGAGLTLRGGQLFLVVLNPNTNSGPTPIVHTGYEFVFCLEGRLTFVIDERNYQLDPGDSLLFEAHLPHYWKNMGETPSRSLMVLCPSDENDHPTDIHFATQTDHT
ncbi:MAG: helix-turn-helix transcriptional regulator [Anaerolineales bacterium]|nr:helix-turn-helix transcriptional regulator [Anaerolineales bacterium]